MVLQFLHVFFFLFVCFFFFFFPFLCFLFIFSTGSQQLKKKKNKLTLRKTRKKQYHTQNSDFLRKQCTCLHERRRFDFGACYWRELFPNFRCVLRKSSRTSGLVALTIAEPCCRHNRRVLREITHIKLPHHLRVLTRRRRCTWIANLWEF